MKVYVLKSAEGKVICTFEKGGLEEDTVRPAIPAGHKVEVVDAPDDYKENLRDFYKKHSGK
jgi:hypothetical protein